MRTTLQARRLMTADGWLANPVLTIEDGVVLAIEEADKAPPPGADVDDTLTPCFFDIHFHGAVGHDVTEATPVELAEVGRFLAAHGVGAYLPTTVTSPVEATLAALERLGRAVEAAGPGSGQGTAGAGKGAQPVGIHLEGPFVSHAKRGVHPAAHLLEPSIALFDRFQQAAGGHIRLMTIAPELPGALELIAHAVAAGVRISLGHSDATAAPARAAIACGARSATHTFNAMRALDHREPGILGTVLDADTLFAELICDGVHVDPVLVRLWLRMKGEGRAILVTDGMSATGMPDGTYRLGGFAVEVRDGTCLADGRLAGSVLTMDRAVAQVQAFTGTSLHTAIRLASANPAAMLDLPQLGVPRVGGPANFNVLDADGTLCATVLGGRREGRGPLR